MSWRILHLCLTAIALSACASSTKSPVSEARSYVSKELPSFKGNFIKDIAPLAYPNSPNLQDFALTLPVYQTDYEDTLNWVTKENGATLDGDSWTLLNDGAQHAVKVTKLPTLPDQPQRIRVDVGPIFNGYAISKWIWTYDLERSAGGWKKLSTKKQLAKKYEAG